MSYGLQVTLEAKDGRQEDLAQFLRDSLTPVLGEPGTTTWYSYRITDSLFGIYDTFPDEAARDAHLSGEVATALQGAAGEFLAGPPTVRKVDIIAAKAAG
ncbi:MULTISPECIES: putative quinol monooxygenase [Pseudonocardia]|uniref:Antibiotic biosynthesis monooxygenase n=2 Tax=Pseudonocardia TaxID=1847 RepID=A0A1Y2MLC3_PSEAH|nr:MULTISPECIES: antibiotic biosynthesis monooxygenase [Pseudonocardia]OSY35841.1 hypothetical protein BG845_05804 [Pseudonocardia autotrophica]TDN73135.1 quinol monooxygenase YgiN [Pseudonocardia autotrophica]BBG03854.1 hypothetical protein Pdca_50630 [Pseudonocardia autotrophica]GEC27347.1 hypothetical protein PSA01_43760 [Pseudonocardia saturnea]